ncbi:glycosyltransferase family 9 protein, partial [Azospirillum sp.]|uniref:O-linked N-acetylglucosamine transferase family protein n=1 Tax=Azospirillum sp. TaxID=34012 RepID=UPI002D4E7E8A
MADTHFNVANLFTQAHRRAEALVHYQAAARLLPNGLHTQREYLYNLLFGCHFDEADRMAAAFRAVVRHHLAAERDWRRIADVVYLSVLVALDDALFPPIFERFAALLPEEPGAMARARAAAPPRPDGRLRIGYLSPNFGNHPVGHVTLSLYGLHDRSRFEVFAFSLEDRAHEAEPFHRQIRAGVDHFEEIGHLSDAAAAAAIRAHGIHILIDLNGCMTPKRLGIPAHRAAPVQVYWLGHAGGVGIPSLDYLLADRVVVPDGEPRRYREAVARLPDCYHVTDRAPIAAAVKPRAAYGLADGAVVFCAFNNPQKIDRAGFGLWMAILRQVPGSQLWLTRNDDPALEANLRRAAEAAGVDPGRLVFATRVADKAEHLARHALADLFLDTVTLTASTTALDALWGGLPLLTLRGSRFAGRIAASMLTAVGLAEMIVDTPERFVAQAVALAGDPARLKGLRARLEHQRNSFPLFDTERFARHLERAFETMWANFQAGRPPQDFDVPAIGAGAVPADLSGVVAVCPGAGHPARAFPPARLADICRWLARDPGVRFVVLGGEAERPFAERLPGALDLTGRLTPAEAAAVIRGCKAVLSMDEAPARLAAAEGTPVVVFTSHPSASDPAYESGKVLLLRPDSALWPCEDGCAAPVPHCIANVQDAEVAERIAAFLSGRPFPPPPPSRAPDSGLSER